MYKNDISSYIESEISLFADDCVCYREIKDKEDTMKLQIDWVPGRKEVGYEISTCQMQYDAADKKSDQKAPQYFYTDRSKAVLLLWFLTVLAVCVYTLVQLLC